uniref:tetratricopeptide repeat protein n=1 Tax=Pararhizobium sp. IMCC3301 TaxID=3067904 RepID=UPI002740A9EB|nr:tetratricopeptide repeat protein [Pararhizobium sp. IMCC3301]
MRIFDGIIRIRIVAFVLLACVPAAPVIAFDVTKSTGEESASPMEAFRLGFQAYRAGDKETAVDALQFAASQGSAMAQWKLGRMYAAGDGVEVSPLRAFEYFRDIANAHAEDSPNSPEAPFVANAFVELGGFFMTGINDTHVRQDPYQARQIYAYAASYFGDPNAQYLLAKMYLEGEGGEKNARQAARWLKLAAEKGHVLSQAELGRMLFHGEGLSQRRNRGLKWLIIALDRSSPANAEAIRLIHESAFALASEKERRSAERLAEKWLKKNPPLEVSATASVSAGSEAMPSHSVAESSAVVVAPLEPLLPISTTIAAGADTSLSQSDTEPGK